MAGSERFERERDEARHWLAETKLVNADLAQRAALAEQDAARLAEAMRCNLALTCNPPLHRCSMDADGHAALAAHEERVRSGGAK